MKILESQNAVLTNFEVYQHLVDQQKRYNKHSGDSVKRRMPSNMKTVVKELLVYLESFPSPLSQDPISYEASSITRLVEQLQPYDITKGEMIMILNLRPINAAVLCTCVEDMAERFTDDQQIEMLNIIAEVLGQFPPREDQGGDAAGADKETVQSIEG